MSFVFNRYWICDSSGIGRDKWRYFEGDFQGDLDEARLYILETRETWANSGCSYSIGIELDVAPTQEFVAKKIEESANYASHYARRLEEYKTYYQEHFL